MTSFDEFLAAGGNTANTDPLGRATDAYLSRYKGTSRTHTASDLRVFLTWCTERNLEPLTAQRLHIELYVRWLQEVRRFRPSTVSRRLSVVAGFYRTCVIDGVLEHSPADHVRRPNVPPESPTLGLSHLQFEALLSAARCPLPANRPTPTTSPWSPCSASSDYGSSKPPAPTSVTWRRTRPPGPARRRQRRPGCPGSAPARSRTGHRTGRRRPDRRSYPAQRPRSPDGPARCWRLRHLAAQSIIRLPRMHPHMLRHTFVTTMLDVGVDLRDVQIAARHADPRTTMRYDRARNNLDRHPNYILAAYMASGT